MSYDTKQKPQGQSFAHDRGEAACEARRFGATYRVDRFGAYNAWVGYDYYNADGFLVLQTISASPRN